MAPSLTLFGKTIPSYGLMAVLGYLAALLFVVLRSKKGKYKTEDSIYVFTLGMVGALIGAKVLYLLISLPALIRDFHLIFEDPTAFASLYLTGGMVFYGGLFGGIIGAGLCARSYKDRLSDYYPMVLPAMALFAAFGRIGCFLTGCCYGVETDAAFGIELNQSLIAPHGVKLVPTQLIECGFDLVLFLLMIVLTGKERYREVSLGIYLILYAAFRFCLEFFRGDAARGIFLAFSVSQWISLITLGVCIVWMVRRRQGRKT